LLNLIKTPERSDLQKDDLYVLLNPFEYFRNKS